MNAVVRKDTSIWELVARLASRFGGNQFEVVDHWDADLFAVGIGSVGDARRLVYISSYGKPAWQFAYECEDANAIMQKEDADFAELIQVLEQHLGIAPKT